MASANAFFSASISSASGIWAIGAHCVGATAPAHRRSSHRPVTMRAACNQAVQWLPHPHAQPARSGDALVQTMRVPLHDADVDAFEQPVQLLHRQRRNCGLKRPDEPILLEPLQQQPEAVALPPQDLHAVASSVPEHVHAGGERVQSERLLDEHGQAVDAEPEVNRRAVQVDLQPFVEAEHRILPRTSNSSTVCCSSTPRTSITTPLGSHACTLIAPAWSSPPLVRVVDTTGMATNASRGPAALATTARCRPCRCSRIQRLSWLALMSHSRARRDTDLPDPAHSATNSALAVSSNTLRPSLLWPTTSRRANSSNSSDIRSRVHIRGNVGCQVTASSSRTRFIDRLHRLDTSGEPIRAAQTGVGRHGVDLCEGFVGDPEADRSTSVQSLGARLTGAAVRLLT